MVKRFFSVLMAFLFVLTLFSGCGAPDVDIFSMRSGLTAKKVAKEMGVGINLGNTFEAYYNDDSNMCGFARIVGDGRPSDYEGCWGAIPTTRAIIDGMRDSGFKTVRIPVFWGNGMVDDGTFTINEDFINRVEEVVRWVLEDGMYCVVNMHHYDERLIMFLDRREAVNAAKTVWTQVAEHFKDYGDHLVFEGYNEYLGLAKEGTNFDDNFKFDYCNEMNQTFVDAVRSTGGNNSERILIASGFNTNIDKTTDYRFKMPTDTVENKMMVSVHYIDNAMYWMKQIGGDGWYDYSKSQCELLKSAFTDNDIPVFVGETTASYEGQMVYDAKYGTSEDCIEELMKMAKKQYGFVPVFWDVHHSDGSGFYNRAELKIGKEQNARTVEQYGK